MKSSWLPEMHIKYTGDKHFQTNLRLSSDSPWFEGHFPQKPILPAVAMIFLVLHLARKALEKPGLKLLSIPRSRIRGLILPDQEIELSCEIQEKEDLFSVRFEIKRQGERVGDGRMEIE